MANPRIVSIEWARLEGQRPRAAGSNARLGEHGKAVRVPVARLTSDDGATGFGFCRATVEEAQSILGTSLGDLFDPRQGATAAGMPFEYPLWDMAGKRACLGLYMHRCLGPCIGVTTKEDSAEAVQQAILFLEGKHEGVVKDIARYMSNAAESLHVERAAASALASRFLGH